MDVPSFPSRLIRSILSYAPVLGLIPKPYKLKPQGISAMMRIKNVADWIEASVLSIRDFADEIIVIDNGSTDGTIDVLKKIFSQHTINIKIYFYPKMNLIEISNTALSLTNYRWVIRWDGDMVARTEGEFDIKKLRNYILSLNPNVYYVSYFRHVDLAGDLEHQPDGRGFRCEDYIHSYSPKVKYVLREKIERIKIPKYFKILDIKGFYSFHVNIKPKRETFYRSLLHDWMTNENLAKFPTLEDYVKYIVKEQWGGDIKLAEETCLNNLCNKLVSYNYSKFGNYPSLIENLRNSCRYRVFYEDGIPIGRKE